MEVLCPRLRPVGRIGHWPVVLWAGDDRTDADAALGEADFTAKHGSVEEEQFVTKSWVAPQDNVILNHKDDMVADLVGAQQQKEDSFPSAPNNDHKIGGDNDHKIGGDNANLNFFESGSLSEGSKDKGKEVYVEDSLGVTTGQVDENYVLVGHVGSQIGRGKWSRKQRGSHPNKI